MSKRFGKGLRSQKGSVLAEYVYLLLGVVVTTALALSILGAEISSGLAYVGYNIDALIDQASPSVAVSTTSTNFDLRFQGASWNGEFIYDPLVNFDAAGASVIGKTSGSIEQIDPTTNGGLVTISLPDLDETNQGLP